MQTEHYLSAITVYVRGIIVIVRTYLLNFLSVIKDIHVQAWNFSKFREMIHHYRVCAPCRNERNFHFPQ